MDLDGMDNMDNNNIMAALSRTGAAAADIKKIITSILFMETTHS